VHRRPGPGPTLLFLHYWGGSAKTWDAVINALPERDTVAITQRGWGESARLGGPYGLQQFADDVETIIDRLDLSEVVPVGHSTGGKVAQIMAGRGTPTLTRLILVAPAPPVPPQHITSKYRQQLPRLRQRGRRRPAVLAGAGPSLVMQRPDHGIAVCLAARRRSASGRYAGC
jgi:pimeloyl-ACP methyl ester carboxylesterase